MPIRIESLSMLAPLLVTLDNSAIPVLLKRYRFEAESLVKNDIDELCAFLIQSVQDSANIGRMTIFDFSAVSTGDVSKVASALYEIRSMVDSSLRLPDLILLSPAVANGNDQVLKDLASRGVSTRIYRPDDEERASNKRYRDTGIYRVVFSAQQLLKHLRLLKARRNLGAVGFDLFCRLRAETHSRISEALDESGQHEVVLNDETVNFAYWLKQPESKTLTIFFNGAIDPKRAKGRPVFQRRTWWNTISGSHLSVPDPTQSKFPELALGWSNGSEEEWAVIKQAAVAQGCIDAWRDWCGDQPPYRGEIRLYGSSGGGFQALAVGALVDATEVIVNNPQLDWSRYEYKSHVHAVAERVYGVSVEQTVENFPERTNIIELWNKLEYAPTFDLLVNGASRNDVTLQTSLLLEWLKNPVNGALASNSSVRFYFAPADGHNPLLPEEAFDLLNRNSAI